MKKQTQIAAGEPVSAEVPVSDVIPGVQDTPAPAVDAAMPAAEPVAAPEVKAQRVRSASPVRARVLAGSEGYGLQAGQVVEGAEAVVSALAAAGLVDPHPEAVAYAVSQGAAVLRLAEAA